MYEEKSIYKFFYPWGFANLVLCASHPVERLKVVVQTSLGQNSFSAVKQFAINYPKCLYQGFLPAALKLNILYPFRVALLTNVPNWVDGYQFDFISSAALKAFAVSSLDTLIAVPFDNIKLCQMNPTLSLPFSKTVTSLYKQNGSQRFFWGAKPAITKSFAAWFYFFIGYHATQDKRERENIVSNVFWATVATSPLIFVTNPFDVVQTQLQSSLEKNKETPLNVAKKMVKEYGFTSLYKGAVCRLFYKSLGAAIGYTVMELSSTSNAQLK